MMENFEGFPHTCEVCDCVLKYPQSAEQHYNGKKHKLRALQAKNPGSTSNPSQYPRSTQKAETTQNQQLTDYNHGWTQDSRVAQNTDPHPASSNWGDEWTPVPDEHYGQNSWSGRTQDWQDPNERMKRENPVQKMKGMSNNQGRRAQNSNRATTSEGNYQDPNIPVDGGIAPLMNIPFNYVASDVNMSTSRAPDKNIQPSTGSQEEGISCDVCSLSFKNSKQLMIHCNGFLHKKRMLESKGSEQTEETKNEKLQGKAIVPSPYLQQDSKEPSPFKEPLPVPAKTWSKVNFAQDEKGRLISYGKMQRKRDPKPKPHPPHELLKLQQAYSSEDDKQEKEAYNIDGQNQDQQTYDTNRSSHSSNQHGHGPNQYQDKHSPNQYQDKHGPNQYRNKSGPNQYQHEKDSNQYKNRKGPNQNQNETGPNQYQHERNMDDMWYGDVYAAQNENQPQRRRSAEGDRRQGSWGRGQFSEQTPADRRDMMGPPPHDAGMSFNGGNRDNNMGPPHHDTWRNFNKGNRDKHNQGNRYQGNNKHMEGNRGQQNRGNRGQQNQGNRGQQNHGNRGQQNQGNIKQQYQGNRGQQNQNKELVALESFGTPFDAQHDEMDSQRSQDPNVQMGGQVNRGPSQPGRNQDKRFQGQVQGDGRSEGKQSQFQRKQNQSPGMQRQGGQRKGSGKKFMGKKKGMYNCHLCDYSFSNLPPFENHMTSTIHSLNFMEMALKVDSKTFRAKYAGLVWPFTDIPADGKVPARVTQPLAQGEFKPLWVLRSGLMHCFTCKICGTNTLNTEGWLDHCDSFKHKKSCTQLMTTLGINDFMSRFWVIPGPHWEVMAKAGDDPLYKLKPPTYLLTSEDKRTMLQVTNKKYEEIIDLTEEESKQAKKANRWSDGNKSAEKKAFKCEVCNRQYDDENVYQSHMKAHETCKQMMTNADVQKQEKLKKRLATEEKQREKWVKLKSLKSNNEGPGTSMYTSTEPTSDDVTAGNAELQKLLQKLSPSEQNLLKKHMPSLASAAPLQHSHPGVGMPTMVEPPKPVPPPAAVYDPLKDTPVRQPELPVYHQGALQPAQSSVTYPSSLSAAIPKSINPTLGDLNFNAVDIDFCDAQGNRKRPRDWMADSAGPTDPKQTRQHDVMQELAMQGYGDYLQSPRDAIQGQGQVIQGQGQIMQGQGQMIQGQGQGMQGQGQVMQGQGQVMQGQIETIKGHGQVMQGQVQVMQGQGQTMQDREWPIQGKRVTMQSHGPVIQGQGQIIQGKGNVIQGQAMQGQGQVIQGQGQLMQNYVGIMPGQEHLMTSQGQVVQDQGQTMTHQQEQVMQRQVMQRQVMQGQGQVIQGQTPIMQEKVLKSKTELEEKAADELIQQALVEALASLPLHVYDQVVAVRDVTGIEDVGILIDLVQVIQVIDDSVLESIQFMDEAEVIVMAASYNLTLDQLIGFFSIIKRCQEINRNHGRTMDREQSLGPNMSHGESSSMRSQNRELDMKSQDESRTFRIQGDSQAITSDSHPQSSQDVVPLMRKQIYHHSVGNEDDRRSMSIPEDYQSMRYDAELQSSREIDDHRFVRSEDDHRSMRNTEDYQLMRYEEDSLSMRSPEDYPRVQDENRPRRSQADHQSMRDEDDYRSRRSEDRRLMMSNDDDDRQSVRSTDDRRSMRSRDER